MRIEFPPPHRDRGPGCGWLLFGVGVMALLVAIMASVR